MNLYLFKEREEDVKRKRKKGKKPRRIDRFFMDEQRSSTTT
jgi:hypothetical protein